ncbi:protein O-mannosyl-transferase family [Chryseobacterium sp. MIQD13]|uniref:protein O-mannosyl-transferase family n=1 Tax=Chryseobacterium sp. MIQD13 TaxID=3422310 RepID=UPI003D2D1487
MFKNFYAVFIFFIFLAIYYAGSFTRIPFADCVGFVHMVEIGKYITVATAITHFLYANTGILIKDITGLDAIAASRLLIIGSAAATVSVIYLTIMSITKKEWVSITAAFVFGLSFSFWRNAEIVEVYTYNAFWISLFFFSMVKTFTEHKKKYIVLSGAFLGISLWLHIQNVLLAPALLVFLYYFKEEKKYAYSSLFIFLFLFLSITVLNVSQGLPLNSPYTAQGAHWIQDTFKKTPKQYLIDLVQSVAYLVYNFNIFIIFGIIGIIHLYRSDKKMFFVFFTASFCVYGFSTFYAVSDNYVFFIPFNMIFALSIGYGLSLPKYAPLKKFSWICLFIPLGYYATYKMAFFTEQGRNFHEAKKYKGGLDYYLVPWMNNNVGILKFIIEKKKSPDPMHWMINGAKDYIELMKSKGYTEEEIKKL